MTIPDIQRVAWFNGQRLTAADMTDTDDSARQLRWLHNSSLHGWGIATGLLVSGNVGDRAVTVTPGYALDCLGRELILGSAVTMAVPGSFESGAAVTYYLIASWLDDADQTVVTSRAGVCSGNGAVRLSDSPLLAWRTAQNLNQGLEVVLAQVVIQNCAISSPISSTARRNALPAQQPYIASGQVAATALTWTPWPSATSVLGWQAQIDTSAAQFAATPQYFVQMKGERYLTIPPGPLMVVGLAAAANPTSGSFTFQVALPQGPGNVNPPSVLTASNLTGIVTALGWQITWIGVED